MDGDAGAWIDREVTECRLPDERLTKRLRKLLDQMAGAMGGRIPLCLSGLGRHHSRRPVLLQRPRWR